MNELEEIIYGPCACIGPMYDEPFCYCKMRQKGLPLNLEAREEARKEFDKSFSEFFKRNKKEKDGS